MQKSNRILAGLIFLASCHAIAAAAQQNIPQSSKPESRVLPAIGLTPTTSPHREFSILVPKGWTMTQVPGAPLATILAPAGQKAPAIYLVLLAVSDLRYQTMLNRCTQQYARNPLFAPNMISGCIAPSVRAQLGDSSVQWSATQALHAVLQTFSGANARFQITNSKEASPGLLSYQVSSVENEQPLQHWGEVSMSYLPNPLLSQAGRSGVTSLALVTGCRVSPQQEIQFRTLCASVLRSFRPAPGWPQAVAQQFMQEYQQESQTLLGMGNSMANNMGVTRTMIGNFGATMQQMQTATYEQIQKANYRTQQNWIAALGENVNMIDPITGKVYTLPDGYGNYCLDASGSEVLEGRDVELGRSVGNSSPCSTMLQPW